MKYSAKILTPCFVVIRVLFEVPAIYQEDETREFLLKKTRELRRVLKSIFAKRYIGYSFKQLACKPTTVEINLISRPAEIEKTVEVIKREAKKLGIEIETELTY